MNIKWSEKALNDLARLYEFLAVVNRSAATKTVKTLTKAPHLLVEHPYMGEQLDEFLPRKIRRLIIAQYEIRYELRVETLYILRIWHTREHR